MDRDQKNLLIRNVLTRGVDSIYPSREAFEKLLKSGKRIKVYIGIDPTGPHLHIGHLTNFLTLKWLQQLGHEVILLVGDFTAQIGDPTDRLAARRPLTPKEIRANLATFRTQIGRILPLRGKNAARFMFNSKWLGKMHFAEVTRLSQQITVQQMLERDMFQKRIKGGKPIGVHEFLYPLMQGYDSVAMGVNLEIGGTDQTFNMLMGRTLMKTLSGKEKLVLTTKLLEHPMTRKKLMNKSEGGTINLDDKPEEIFGKIMALDDVSMFPVAEFSSEMPLEDIRRLKEGVERRTMNPRDAKLEVAHAVVATIYGAPAAEKAAERFESLFSKRTPATKDAPELTLSHRTLTSQDLVVASRVVKSNSEAWRLVAQGGLEVDGKVIREPKRDLTLRGGETVRIGKKRFFSVRVK